MERPGDRPQAINLDNPGVNPENSQKRGFNLLDTSTAFIKSRYGRALTALGALAIVFSAHDFKPTDTASANHEIGIEKCNPLKFDRSEFKDPLNINNPWFPLEPGTQFVMEGTSNRGEGVRRHRLVVTVTDLEKEIDGVRTRVVMEEDFTEGILAEREIFFAAQDNAGNVVKFGQYPELFEDEGITFVGAPLTWIAGEDGAEAGVLVPGKPVVGLTFSQGFAPEVDAEFDFLDCGEVASVDGNRLIIHERSPFESEGVGIQRKHSTFGEGLTFVDAIDDPESEILEIKSVSRLTTNDMDKIWLVVRILEDHARAISPVYRRTKPIESPKPRPVKTAPVSITPPKSGDAGLATVEN